MHYYLASHVFGDMTTQQYIYPSGGTLVTCPVAENGVHQACPRTSLQSTLLLPAHTGPPFLKDFRIFSLSLFPLATPSLPLITCFRPWQALTNPFYTLCIPRKHLPESL